VEVIGDYRLIQQREALEAHPVTGTLLTAGTVELAFVVYGISDVFCIKRIDVFCRKIKILLSG